MCRDVKLYVGPLLAFVVLNVYDNDDDNLDENTASRSTNIPFYTIFDSFESIELNALPVFLIHHTA